MTIKAIRIGGIGSRVSIGAVTSTVVDRDGALVGGEVSSSTDRMEEM